MNLLMIDDDDIDRMNTTRALERSGYVLNVTEARSVEEGLAYQKNGNFDIILLDYQLPSMSGLELLKVFTSSHQQDVAVVMLSNQEDDNIAIECIEAGAQDFILKSEVTTSRLIRALLHAKERSRIGEQLRLLAERDTLTGLANRYIFETQLEEAIARAIRYGEGLALLMLDLDKFKNVNDTLGHAVGDKLLIEVANRLKGPVRSGDLICRLGGDEFAILVHHLDDTSQLRIISQRIIDALSEPFEIEGTELNISTSIGIASYPECGQDKIQLMKCADIAMYRAKEKGRNQAQFYSKDVHHENMKRQELEQELFRAIENKEIEVFYQPLIDVETEKTVGAEALVRWRHPTRGLLLPNAFLSIAEDTGEIGKIGYWILDTVCAQYAEWKATHPELEPSFAITVNLSALQLDDSRFVDHTKLVLAKYSMRPENLELEVTESSLIENSETAASVLQDLSRLGVKLSLDDFGIGHSSLSYLQKHPFNILKIDRSFVQNVEDDNDSAAMFLKSINALADVLNIKTVVEGIETKAQKHFCQKLKFERMQGFYFSKAMDAPDFSSYLLKNSDMRHEMICNE
ncbi:GGDEF domain-containing response regulator [Sneathiella sp. HT1-7]|uniref:two-component system response regulator n=1 Tax=Sneathiella sp. HT1-7 TaxID=2887192 RepID=UPI001D13EAB4|nr:GGDEF domain-containing response regulator [Sneathiella sp. HT1-7]MCC3304596.1 EAL domain-containing protein [Sneathiella sp. HT1-7]